MMRTLLVFAKYPGESKAALPKSVSESEDDAPVHVGDSDEKSGDDADKALHSDEAALMDRSRAN